MLFRSWLYEVLEKAIRVIQQALDNSFSGMLDWQTGHCQLASNRDLIDPEETAQRILCGYNPLAAADSTLLVGRVTDASQHLRAVLVNYACHPTTLAWENVSLSPDFLGAMRELIEQQTGAAALFLQGASGELAPRYQYTGDTAVADRHGRQLGYAALATLENMEPPATELVYREVRESGAPLAVWRHQPRTVAVCLQAECSTVEIPLKDWPTAEEFDQQFRDCADRTLSERLRRKRDIRRSLGDGPTYLLPFWTWKLGEAILVGCPAEAYSILQRELRLRYPQETIICLNLVNGSNGYLPPRELYSRDIYPVAQTPFDQGALELTIEALSQSIEQIKAAPSLATVLG